MTESSVPTSRDQFSLLSPYVAPRTATEAKIAEIWQRALAVDRVGVVDSYEDLGGNSLLAAAIVVEVQKAFAIETTMDTFVQSPTIEELASKIDELTRAAKDQSC
jgi:tyrocidine synthetase-3